MEKDARNRSTRSNRKRLLPLLAQYSKIAAKHSPRALTLRLGSSYYRTGKLITLFFFPRVNNGNNLILPRIILASFDLRPFLPRVSPTRTPPVARLSPREYRSCSFIASRVVPTKFPRDVDSFSRQARTRSIPNLPSTTAPVETLPRNAKIYARISARGTICRRPGTLFLYARKSRPRRDLHFVSKGTRFSKTRC